MSLDLGHEFDFTVSSDYTTSGDALISGGVLTLEDPAEALPWYRKWDPTPSFDGNGDAILAQNVQYGPKDGAGNDIFLQDGLFVFWVKHSSLSLGKGLFASFRKDLSGELKYGLSAGFGSSLTAQYYDYPGVLMVSDNKWATNWASTEWRQMFVHLCGDTVQLILGTVRGVAYRDETHLDTGNILLVNTDTTGYWIVAEQGGAHEEPYVYYRRQGACALKEAAAFTFPANTTGMKTLSVVDNAVVTDNILVCNTPFQFPHTLQYDVYTGGAWQGWVTVPDDGDMSGVAVAAGDKLLWRIDDGAGVGMDNGVDPRNVPSIGKVNLVYTVSGDIGSDNPTAHRRDAVKAGPRKGAYD